MTLPEARCLPQGDALELLRAALEPDHTLALAAWQRWRAHHSLQECELSMHRLMPVIHRRFQPPDISAEDHRILRGVHRYNWVRNHLLYKRARQVLTRMQQAGIPTLVSKGLPLSLREYGDAGCRPMGDFDVLVPPQQRDQALDVLRQDGWLVPDYIQPLIAHHSCDIRHPLGQQTDLHWYSLTECRWPGADDAFWARSQEMEQLPTRRLRAEDALLVTCVHGLRQDADPLGWICDAHHILSSHPALDYEHLLAAARERRVVPALRLTLNYLKRHFDLGIPAAALDKLAQFPVAWTDRCYFQCLVQPRHHLNFWAIPVLDFLRCRRRGDFAEFAEYLRGRWFLTSLSQAPAHAWGRIWSRLIRRQG